MRTITGFFAQLIFSMTVFALNMLFISIAGLLRLLPVALPAVGRAAWGLVILSCRLYYLLLTRIAPIIQQRVRINILEGLWRLVVTLGVSLTLGVSGLLLAQLPLTIWTIVPLVLHGLFVDFIWDDIPQTGSIQMGVRL